MEANRKFQIGSLRKNGGKTWRCLMQEGIIAGVIDLFHIVCAHAYIGHVARYFSIIGETLQRWGKRILSH